jgi:DNA-binding HxlR family transcriptional regulator
MAVIGGHADTPWQAAGAQPRAHRSWTPLARALTATGDHWTLLIVLQLATGRARVGELQRSLPGVSTGALERCVQHMEALGLLTKARFREMPPRVELELTETGRELLPIAGALARWGMLHMWSQPHDCEGVNIESLLRLLPALLEDRAGFTAGRFQAVVEQPDLPADLVSFKVEHGRLRIDPAPEEQPQAHPDRVVGDSTAWVAALGPEADYRGLVFTGERALATSILDALPGRTTDENLDSA